MKAAGVVLAGAVLFLVAVLAGAWPRDRILSTVDAVRMRGGPAPVGAPLVPTRVRVVPTRVPLVAVEPATRRMSRTVDAAAPVAAAVARTATGSASPGAAESAAGKRHAARWSDRRGRGHDARGHAGPGRRAPAGR